MENPELKIGLEIHQQLSTNKLFCNCSSDMTEKDLELTFKRKIRPVAGETGEVDVATRYEFERGRAFIYHGYKNEFCLIETDDEPPLSINKEALKTALEVATFLKLNIPKTIVVMRKNVSDGSAVSSYQRTMLIGYESNGSFIETSQGKVRISSLCLEEDSSKIENAQKDKVIYSLSRLGIPLLELMTEPDIKTPEQAKEVAEKIGLILRSFENIKRGIGTIRQDLNISVNNGQRVEIKGFQDIRVMPTVLKNEIKRQLSTKVQKEVRKANSDGTTDFLRPLPGAARMYPDTDIPHIEVSKELLKEIKEPELITEKVLRFERQFKLNSDLARLVVKEKEDLFLALVNKFKPIDPSFIAQTLVLTTKDLKSRLKLDPKKLRQKEFEEVFSYLEKDLVSKDAIQEILADIIQNKKIELKKYKKVSTKDLEKDIKDIVSKNKNLSINAIMGIVMKKYKGKVDGKLVFEIIKKELK